jgi:hypothetical protein
VGETTFWWGFNTKGGYVGPNHQISVADVNGDGFEECVLYDIESGIVRFFKVERNKKTGGLKRLVCQDQGQIPFGKNYLAFDATRRLAGRLIWAKLKNLPSEAGQTNARDDVFVYHPTARRLARYDARWDDGDGFQTFWYAYQRDAPEIVSMLGLS